MTDRNRVTVDVHWHHVPPSFLSAVASGACPVFGKLEGPASDPLLVLDGGWHQDFPADLTDPKEQIAAMDAAGLDVVAASIAPPLMHLDAEPALALNVARTLNDGLAELVDFAPDRFKPLATVPLQDAPAAAAELHRAMTELGLAGVQIDTNVNGKNLGDEEFRPFWRAVADLDAFVFMHPGPARPIGKERLVRHGQVNFVGLPIDSAAAVASLIFDGVYEEFGPLKTCLAHGGGAFPYLLSRWEHGYRARHARNNPSVRAPSEYLDSIYCDSLTHSDASMAFLVELLGPGHVLLGSDFPFDMGNHQPLQTMERIVSDEGARAAIGGNTAAQLLGIDPV
jgi:aminocarboxymuconate-semialdehyde decarboxylase